MLMLFRWFSEEFTDNIEAAAGRDQAESVIVKLEDSTHGDVWLSSRYDFAELAPG